MSVHRISTSLQDSTFYSVDKCGQGGFLTTLVLPTIGTISISKLNFKKSKNMSILRISASPQNFTFYSVDICGQGGFLTTLVVATIDTILI
jgi:hypothetical protein